MLYDAEHGDISLMLLGDVMPTRRLSTGGQHLVFVLVPKAFRGPR